MIYLPHNNLLHFIERDAGITILTETGVVAVTKNYRNMLDV
jgi:hypothetical protein